MSRISRLILTAGVALAAGFSTLPPATAAEFPTKQINLVAAGGPGGAVDTLARIVARTMEKDWGQNVVVVNKPGAGGALGAGQVKNDASDGHTLVVGHTGTFSTTWQSMDKATYGVDDFTYINTLTTADCAWVTRGDSPYKTLKDVWAAAKSGKTISYGALTPESKKFASYIAGKEGAQIKAITLKSVPEILQAVLGGHVDFGFSGGGHGQYVKKGDLRVLAAVGGARVSDSPDVPTLKEMGYNISDCAVFMIAGPKGIPADIVKKLADIVSKAMNSEEAKKFLESRNSAAMTVGPDGLEKIVKEEAAAYVIVKDMPN